MLSKKLLKRLSLVLGLGGVVIFVTFSYLFYNPLEGKVAEVRDLVPRGVDFFAAKRDLAEDFEGDSLAFPYVPALEEMGQRRHWLDFKDSEGYREIGQQLRQLRKAFQESTVDVRIHTINLLDEFLGAEIQVAGYLGNQGFGDARWCAYARVSMWAKIGYGWLLENGFSRDQLQGVRIENDGEFFKISAQGQVFYCVRYLDVLMLSNDRQLLSQSFELAQDNDQEVEPLGRSAHFIDGVRRPLRDWSKLTGVNDPNVVEFHLQPNKLVPKMPGLRNWGKNIDEDNRNEKILASFINLDSWRFLSGATIFENNSLSMLMHLVVNENMHTRFQKGLFNENVQPRSKWMNEFFSMVPQTAIAAAALRLPAGDFINELFNDVLDQDERKLVNEQLKRTGKYKNFQQLVAEIDRAVRPRVGIILRPNRRSQKTKEVFDVHNQSAFPQWAWVFWIKKRRDQLQSKPLSDLIKLLNTHRSAFNVQKAFTLKLQGGGSRDVAFEFAIPQIPGTGNISVCTYGKYFIFGNSGPFIESMSKALSLPDVPSMAQDESYLEMEEEISSAVNGVGFVWAKNLRLVGEDFKRFAEKLDEPMDNFWARQNRPKAERLVFQRKYRHLGTLSQAQKSPQWPEIDRAIEAELDRMWAAHQKSSKVTDAATLQQFLDLTEVFRSAYIEMVMKSDSLQVRGRVLERNYR